MEHRLGQRVAIDVSVRIIGVPGALGIGKLRDISASGSFVRTRLPLPVLSMIEIILPHKMSGESRTLTGYVVRSTPIGLGIEWSDFAPPAIMTLMDLHQVPVDSQVAASPRSHAMN